MKKQIKKIIKRIIVDRAISRNSKWGSFWNYRHGFLQETVDVCGITKENYKDFLSDRKYRMSHPINGPYSSIIDNKLWLPFLLKDYKEYCPRYYFIKKGISFYKFGTNQNVSINLVLNFVKEKGVVACKHTHSSLGFGFFVLEYSEGVFLKNKKKILEQDLFVFLSSLDEYIITEYVEQHEYASKVAKESLNTVRLLTVWNNQSKQFEVLRAFHRFGADGSVVDNIGSGSGVLAFVNVETGVLTGEGVINCENREKKFVENIIHPNSKIVLKGLKIPYYMSVCDKVLEIANSHSYLKYVGWDIAITDDSFKIIETNSLSSLNVVQQREGFLVDPILKTYFE